MTPEDDTAERRYSEIQDRLSQLYEASANATHADAIALYEREIAFLEGEATGRKAS